MAFWLGLKRVCASSERKKFNDNLAAYRLIEKCGERK